MPIEGASATYAISLHEAQTYMLWLAVRGAPSGSIEWQVVPANDDAEAKPLAEGAAQLSAERAVSRYADQCYWTAAGHRNAEGRRISPNATLETERTPAATLYRVGRDSDCPARRAAEAHPTACVLTAWRLLDLANLHRRFGVQRLAAVLGDGVDILDAHAKLARQVDARLNGEAMPDFQETVVSLREIGRLVDG
jgi:hypothetical protein